MKKINLIVPIVIFLIVANTLALKVKVFTMKELIDEADVIVIACIATEEDGTSSAKVQKAIKGDPEKFIRLHTFSLRDTDVVQFEDNEKTLLFLGSVEPDGGRKLIGYGDQGKWPKRDVKWPYTAAHVSSVEQVESLVAELVQKQRQREEIEARLAELLKSDDPFNQVVALEYLESSDYKELRKLLRLDIERISKSKTPALKQKALFIKSLDENQKKKELGQEEKKEGATP